MNDLEKKSFYSFLGLYTISSFLFILLVGYWYYTAQKNALENAIYYKLEHIADTKAGEIIMAQMDNKKIKKISNNQDIKLALINTKGKVIDGELIDINLPIKTGYFKYKGYEVIISEAPRKHLDILYVIVQSNMLSVQLKELKNMVIEMVTIVFFMIIFMAWILSRLFMKPIRQKVEQIEDFINDVTHELNTPITSLSMATDQALKIGECTPKTLNNISISTKQLYDIYISLTYLNFHHKEEIPESININSVLERSIDYYTPLAEVKRINFNVDLEDTESIFPESQLILLFGNLIGNAIKYSSPNSKIIISLKNRVFKIKDEGIGIEEAEQNNIFEKFKRGTSYSGGFGVGLNIVKNICDKHNIKIELESVFGEGTEFRLYF